LASEGLGVRRGHGELAAPAVVVVLFESERHGTIDRRPFRRAELGVGAMELVARGMIGDVERPIVQILRGEIRPQIGAVAPDRAVVHQAVLQEHLLPSGNVGAGEDDRAGGIDDLGRDRRRVLVSLDRDQDQDAESHHHRNDGCHLPPR